MVALALMLGSMSEAFTNVVSDAIMVIQSRRDKRYGSQDFVSLMFLATGIGGVIGCIFAGLVTQYSHPKWCFFSYAFLGIIVSLFACRLTPESERDQVVEDGESGISSSQQSYEFRVRKERILQKQSREEVYSTIPKREGFCYNLGKNCRIIGRALTHREIYFLVIFFLVYALINPRFEEFSYFFLLNVVHITKFIFSLLVLIGQICNVIGALIYRAWCRDTETRWMVFFAFVA